MDARASLYLLLPFLVLLATRLRPPPNRCLAVSRTAGRSHRLLGEFTLRPNSTSEDFSTSALWMASSTPLCRIGAAAWSGAKTTSLPNNINSVCPSELAVRGSDGSIVACKSACLAFNQPQYCCTGAYGTAETCPPTNYSKIFKNQCPQAYSYAYDDKSSTFTCAGGADYLITFCP
ncbi:hypothetical protein NL676_009652 [Syzygium grande]|nr:hypothetical protein NL676_009652 [Syzygium grande]